ncbi:3-isopropylmalate dehydratase large subunit [Rhizobium sp. ERR 922]|uniref:3-isopropylmalate dehydratase large subunit n=1 Tax=unclassified Rhizobium TaxID=2613769 RepID=UPI0011ACDDA7|nr:3-isopropylmalate dehydratase large subunit [Rhizobium sp. ERR 922]TWB95917.1 3-isopropylmalate dehydratase large subunit [Rhizobium sp. ERR 942]
MTTLFDKVWKKHVIRELGDGVVLLHIDRHYLHDLEGGPNLHRIEQLGYRVHNPELTFATPDHAISTLPPPAVEATGRGLDLLHQLRLQTKRAGVRLFDMRERGHGIVHVMAPELGLTLPGMTVACPDSHTCTHGGLGALGLAIGSSEVAHILATQTLRQRRPKQMRIVYTGTLAFGVTAKDLILATIGLLGTAAGRGFAVEFAGEPIARFTVDERLTFCNLTIELGSRTGLIAPDDTTFSYLAEKEYAPKGRDFDRAVAQWRQLPTDPESHFDVEHHIDVSKIGPQISWGTSPQDVIAIDGKVPDPASQTDPKLRQRMVDALAYMGLKPGAPMDGLPIDWVFIGSCTNARLSDLRRAASLLKGRKIAPNVRAWVVPGSEDTKRSAEAEGLHEIFIQAGFEWRMPGCSMCLAANGEVVPPGQRSISTTNRNFVGRQGPGARTHLASPEMAAAAAVVGKITDARQMMVAG